MSDQGAGYVKDTISAIATAPGRGGIGIVRISGPLVAKIAEKVLGRLPQPRYATFANFRDDNLDAIDQGIGLYFPGPDSFTGEDVLELQGHGGPVVLDMLLNRVVRLGARIAEPGEFSQRAFLNDKLDLAQAEAIADLIDSGTQLAARGAMRSLQGQFSRRIGELLAKVIELRVFVEAAIDFPEEEIDFLADNRVASRLVDITEQLREIIDEANIGTLLTEGAAVVLIGKPNAGKSSLMNAMTGRDTSIVTHIPGTTRDIVDETLQLDGIPLKLVDTAGIRESIDEIETEGVRRAVMAMEQADLVLALVDASQSLEKRDQDLAELEDLCGGVKARSMVKVFNKIDLLDDHKPSVSGLIEVSAKTGEGMDQLKSHLKYLLGVKGSTESGFTARSRHLSALNRALSAVEIGESALRTSQAGELLAEELKHCQQSLGEITGDFSADDLLGEIFSTFCIGK